MQAEAEQDRLLSILRDELYVAVVSDALDAGGLLSQAMDARLRPLAPGMRLVGRAHTVMTADVYVRPEAIWPRDRSGRRLAPGRRHGGLDESLGTNLFLGRAPLDRGRGRGATGCAIDGHTRDALRIMDMGFPCSPPASGLSTPRRARWSSVMAAQSKSAGLSSTRGTSSSATTTVSSSFHPNAGGRRDRRPQQGDKRDLEPGDAPGRATLRDVYDRYGVL